METYDYYGWHVSIEDMMYRNLLKDNANIIDADKDKVVIETKKKKAAEIETRPKNIDGGQSETIQALSSDEVQDGDTKDIFCVF